MALGGGRLDPNPCSPGALGSALTLLLVWQGGKRVTPGYQQWAQLRKNQHVASSPQQAQLSGDHAGMQCSRCQEAATE